MHRHAVNKSWPCLLDFGTMSFPEGASSESRPQDEGNKKDENMKVVGGIEDADEVEVTIDFGAAKSVWPRRERGVARRKLKKAVNLLAASGTPIEVHGEVTLSFQKNGKQCEMNFLDADVKKPLLAKA